MNETRYKIHTVPGFLHYSNRGHVGSGTMKTRHTENSVSTFPSTSASIKSLYASMCGYKKQVTFRIWS